MAPIVEIASGRLQGIEERGVLAFKAIPYAASPAGELRFRPPHPIKPWAGTRDATKYGPVPFQHPMAGVYGSLLTPEQPQAHDSLLLNVWTPRLSAKGLPVLVWIDGGAYYAGSGSDAMYNGAAFARDDVVCVTINYRLGAEGFLYLDELFEGFENFGCNGTADQIAALEWVRNNIATFGGDPSNVTIAGESAGASSVVTLMSAPRAKGLFRRAICQSGSGRNVVSAIDAAQIASVFLKRAGVAEGDVRALQKLHPRWGVAVQEMLTKELMANPDPRVWKNVKSMQMAFRPAFGTKFLPDAPIDAIANGSGRGIDLLIGSNADETLIFVKSLGDAFGEAQLRARFDELMKTSGKSTDQLLELYRRHRPDAPPYVIAAAIETDRRFRIPGVRLAEAQSRHAENVFMYRFDWRSNAFDRGMGAFHILEVPFTFDNLDDEQSQGFTGEAPTQLATAMHAAWVSFARNGSPSTGSVSPWPRYDLDRRSTMLFDDQCQVVSDPDPAERQIWIGVDI